MSCEYFRNEYMTAAHDAQLSGGALIAALKILNTVAESSNLHIAAAALPPPAGAPDLRRAFFFFALFRINTLFNTSINTLFLSVEVLIKYFNTSTLVNT